MNYRQHSITLAAIISSMIGLTSLAVLADDTEVYVTTSVDSTAQANILFILDSSGSMATQMNTNAPYDSATSYGTASDSVFVYDTNYNYLGLEITSEQNRCNTMTEYLTDTPDEPVYENQRVAYWDNTSASTSSWAWSNICDESNDSCNFTSTTAYVECEDDDGTHGVDDASTDRHAANAEDGPYSNSSSFVWRDQEATYENGDCTRWRNGRCRRYEQIEVTPFIAGTTQRHYLSNNYHNWFQSIGGTITTDSRLNVMKNAVKDLVDSFEQLNFGMMQFNSGEGGYVFSEFMDISTGDDGNTINKDLIKARIDTVDADGTTPLSESLYEASLVFRGEAINQGTPTISAARSGDDYITPIVHSCQKNHIVLLTDGKPYSDGDRNSNIIALDGGSGGTTASCNLDDDNNNVEEADDTCLDEMAAWLYATDHSSASSVQNIYTHVVAMDLDLNLLRETAINGGPEGSNQYYTVFNSQQLISAFNQIVFSISETADTFAAPAVAVNAFNNLQHRNELYFALFKPQITPRWYGNLKRYEIDASGDILDENGRVATDNSGFFKDSGISSWWNAEYDNDQVDQGGMAQQISYARNVYTYTGTVNNLTDDSNKFSTADTSELTQAMLGATSGSERTELIDWALGKDVEDSNSDGSTNDTHHYLSDMLHSQPVVVTYDASDDIPDSNTTYTDIVFAGSNMGYLHAVDAGTGQEKFAFIPEELLDNIKVYKDNSEAETVKPYGMDGPITVWMEESDDPGIEIESADGDHVYVYAGMRRGGSAFYALDVTNVDSPQLMWTINNTVTGFADLAQSWSEPKLAAINDCSSASCASRAVLFFGGGYDPVNDSAGAAGSTDLGNAIYMVDATTGDLLWSAGDNPGDSLTLTEMTSSMAATVTPVDIDVDGQIDYLFAVDMKGQVWRIDFADNYTTAASFATGGRLAHLGDTTGSSAANYRRFYNAPDVAYFRPRGDEAFFTISLTSGFRAHPKDGTVTTDSLFVLYNSKNPLIDAVTGDVLYGDASGNAIDISDLHQVVGASPTYADKSTHPYGWYYTFTGDDEKGLSKTTTFGGVVIFTTFLPNGNDVSCTDAGAGRLYALDVLTGEPKFPTDVEDDYVVFIDLEHGGIPPEVSIIFVSEENSGDGTITTSPVLCSGTECLGADDNSPLNEATPLSKVFWRENP